MPVTVLDFYADWCGPCSMQDPILESAVEQFENASVTKIDVDADTETANEYQVRSLPTLIIEDSDGEIVERFVGMTDESNLVAAIDSAQ